MKTVFDVKNAQINNQPKTIEPSWNYIEEIGKLKSQITDIETNLNFSLRVQMDKLNKRSTRLSEKVNEKLEEHNQQSNKKFNELETFLIDKIDSQIKLDAEQNNKVHTDLDLINEKLNRLYLSVDANDNQDSFYIRYRGLSGPSKDVLIKTYTPDEETLTYSTGKLKLKHQLNNENFIIKNDVVNCIGFTLTDGQYLSADSLDINIRSLTQKLDGLLKKVNNINGYIASNNFKTGSPSQEQLSTFAINCLSSSTNQITNNLIPTGTKIKNTFDNHIWVLNRFTVDGLSTSKWEDFGSDNVCLANNDGVHGLVSGSREKLKGHIDLNGVISINGLQEELESMLKSVVNITTDVSKMKSSYDQKLLELENRIRILEGK